MKVLLLSPLMGIMTCFLERPLVVIWMRSFGLGLPLMILFTWSIFFALKARKASLIFRTSEVFAEGLVA